ncbi:MAG: hypothetical protein IPK19_37905 [Chloroflexi bacterium]|nr:hypothetical protein [Chloroflexota bacterium]
MSHLIDLSDHYSHFDRRLSPYHFLKFSSIEWRLFNNGLHYQNRLRIADYRDIHSRTGFHVVNEESRTAAAEFIDSIQIAPEFNRYERADLSVTESWMVSRPVGS